MSTRFCQSTSYNFIQEHFWMPFGYSSKDVLVSKEGLRFFKQLRDPSRKCSRFCLSTSSKAMPNDFPQMVIEHVGGIAKITIPHQKLASLNSAFGKWNFFTVLIVEMKTKDIDGNIKTVVVS